KLGEGGMTYVYLAKEIDSGEEVAVKVLSPRLATDRSSVERLRREAGLAMRLDHQNVCRIKRLGESEDGLIYLVMPLLKGELRSDREVKGGPMDVAKGVDILCQVCAGLHHAHELQIVHRDLKPENIMLVPEDDGRDRAVVMDFGLAKERRADPAIAKLTATGIILGTPEFMSPEQIRGKTLDARSDVYALGVVAFELFTGKLPFQGRNAQEMMIARLRGSPMPLRQLRSDVPASLEKALAKAMETNPDHRYLTALEFAEAIAPTAAAGPAARHPVAALGSDRRDLQGVARDGRGGDDRRPRARARARLGRRGSDDPQRCRLLRDGNAHRRHAARLPRDRRLPLPRA